eukprot:snap_masked-scaffold_48-processed-gene-1.94-mRNA-1 protein AED:0.15 eAED:1.00 QI:0/0/0/1/1/1/2/0/356
MCILNCGIHGVCVQDQCVCNPGWSQSLDFAFFVQNRFDFVDDSGRFGQLPCDENLKVLRAIYVIGIIFALSVGAVYGSLVKNKRQFFRLIPIFISVGMGVGCLGYKLKNLREVEVAYGINLPFTALGIGCATLGHFAFLIFIQKYIYFQTKMISVDSSHKKILIRFQRLQYIFCFITVAIFVLSVSLVFIDTDNQAFIIQQTIFGLGFTLLIYITYGADYFIKLVIAALQDQETKQGMSTLKEQTRKYRKNMNILRKCYLAHGILATLNFAIGITSQQGMIYWGMSIIVVFIYQERRIKKFVEKLAFMGTTTLLSNKQVTHYVSTPRLGTVPSEFQTLRPDDQPSVSEVNNLNVSI